MEKEKTICLNMIVKNENHIIKQTFDNLLKYIDFDYWVISDTGSTDGTQNTIIEYFNEKNIEGELFNDEWKDFAYNRNCAMEHAHNKSDYIFIFDADDKISGDFILPKNLQKDAYEFKFDKNYSYNRICLVNNRTRIAKYVGVLHEYICIDTRLYTIDSIKGDYYFESRRLGSRSKNPNKYKDDAKLLEKGYQDENNDLSLKYRYAYYCAQSYQDAGEPENSIKWYKKYLELPSNLQYKYCACINLGHNYKKINNIEQSLYYYALSYNYDSERIEGIAYQMEYYYVNNLHYLVNALWHKFKNYKICNMNEKIFLNTFLYSKFEWYNIVSGFYSNDNSSSYESCKRSIRNNFNIPNVILNLIFYSKEIMEDKDNLVKDFLFNYIKTNNDIGNWKKYENVIKNYNIDKYNLLCRHFDINSIDKSSAYKNSNKIRIYTGYMYYPWNDSILKEASLGGAEKAVIYLSRCLPKDYQIFIAGDQIEEEINNIKYISHNNVQTLLNENTFHTVIVSRYVSFFTQFYNIKCSKLLLSAHDSTGFINNHVKDFTINNILNQYDKYIDNVIALTSWHANNIIERHPYFKNKLKIINNGINTDDFKWDCKNKVKNKFIWSSCAYRGLDIILNLWDKVLQHIPDATLDICSYETFPKNDNEKEMKNIIDKYESITHHGKLNTDELYKLASISEYWLYTNTFPETSCITGMEMLMSEVICLYYPLAGLTDTIGEYGIKVQTGNEIETLLNLSEERKIELINNGKEYALTCSWENRATEWTKILELHKDNIISNILIPKIIDCFIFYNEIDMLTYRLNILNDVVDYFVLVEATHTFVGKEKSLFYKENKHLFEKFNHKIIHIVVDDFPNKYPNINCEKNEQWINENFQRNCISKGIDKLNLNDNDVITITDLDEIPNPKLFKQIKNNEIIVDINIIEMDLYYYNLHSKLNQKWYGSKIICYQKYKELGLSCEQIRQAKNFKTFTNSGWHLSYFGDEKFIKNKIQNFGHQEYNNNNYTDENKIKERINKGKDLYDRSISIINISIEDNNNLPINYHTYLRKFFNCKLNKIGIFNSFPFHYEIFGFILNYAKNNECKVDIFTNQEYDLGWFNFYKATFNNFNVIDFNNFNGNTNNYSSFFVATDDDPKFKSEWITDNVICLNHYYKIRTYNFRHYLNVANFKDSILEYIYPCYPLINYQDKLQNNNVCIIGGGNIHHKHNIYLINNLYSKQKIKLNIFTRKICNTNISDIDTNKFDIEFIQDIETIKMIKILKESSYVLINYNNNNDHNTGISCSGSLQLALSTLCKPIIINTANQHFKIENVLEYDIHSHEGINIDEEIDFKAIEQERNKYVNKFDNYLNNIKQSYNIELNKENLCLLTYGELRTFKTNFRNNLFELLPILQNYKNTFIFILLDEKKELLEKNYNYIENICKEFDIKIGFIETIETSNFNIQEEIDYCNKLLSQKDDDNKEFPNNFVLNLLYRKYKLIELVEEYCLVNKLYVSDILYARLFDCIIKQNIPNDDIYLNIKNTNFENNIYFSPDTTFIGNYKLIKKTMKFDKIYNSDELWNNEDFCNFSYNFDSILTNNQHTYAPEIQYIANIYFNSINAYNLRYYRPDPNCLDKKLMYEIILDSNRFTNNSNEYSNKYSNDCINLNLTTRNIIEISNSIDNKYLKYFSN